jgi:hypothetical protein
VILLRLGNKGLIHIGFNRSFGNGHRDYFMFFRFARRVIGLVQVLTQFINVSQLVKNFAVCTVTLARRSSWWWENFR